MSQDHRMLGLKDYLGIIKSSTPILLLRKAEEARGLLKATHEVS